ncbi:tRNA (adenosine(37)-N6)-threonylcarbamoyltransferase complex dimerization subunit type 1 TsaB [Alteromonadaceae bacterium M269]|nr:tRNA (adenosine(37)-N6)-threonylcarbamoyltransferase complex dimerization subunit type 1 TsaB [Alteromonadaceae bacterium M269]
MTSEKTSTILAIDAATEACSVALSVDGQTFSDFTVCPQQHSQRLLPMIESVLEKAGVKLSEVDYLAYGQGPGSFTGIRIATGMMQGLAMGADIPVVGVSTLAAMAQQIISEKSSTSVVAAIDARMSEVYVASYTNENGLAVLQGQESVLAPAEAVNQMTYSEDTAAVGTGWQAYTELQDLKIAYEPDLLYPSALYMLPLAKKAIDNGLASAVEHAKPTYLRDKVTWKKLPGRE